MPMNSALESALSHFGQRNGELIVGGRPISALAHEFGTPLYIYDRQCLEWRRKTLRQLLPTSLHVNYAVKANPNTEIIRMMGDFYDGLDVASKGEMKRAMEAGVPPSSMSLAGPGKRMDELAFAIENDIGSISVESPRELDHIQSLCATLGKVARIMIRVNPPFEMSRSGMSMGGGPKQFGIDSEMAPGMMRSVTADPRIHLEGIHVFAGSQNLQSSAIIETFRKILELAGEICASSGKPLSSVNLGGGFGIAYHAREGDLDLAAIGNGLRLLMDEYLPKLHHPKLMIELGRFLVGESGIYLTRVLYRKSSRGKTFLITDGGMHHHLAASGNLGQGVVRRPMPITTANKLDGPLEKATVVGCLCTPLDTFGTMELPHAEEGDLLAVMNSGAYAFSASPKGFLSHDQPREVVV